MGDIADYYAMQELTSMSEQEWEEAYGNPDQYKNLPREICWTSGDGTKTPVSEMSDTHIKNIINLIRLHAINFSHPKLGQEWYDLFTKELKKRNVNGSI
tara:strand:+ start:3052 stop:3348 length:297 start_codon:yes stop_codon:yes gene_type:complete